MQEISLRSKLNTDSENITISEGDPTFIEKEQLFWNGTLRNTRTKEDIGFPSTSGKTIKITDAEDGVKLEVGGKTLNMPFTSVLAEHYKIKNKAAGKQIAHAIWNGRVFTLYKNNQQEYTLVETDKDDNEVAFKKVEDTADGVSAMITSVYNINEEPLIFINQKTKYSITNYINKVSVYKLTEYFDFVEEPEYDYVLDASKKADVDILRSNYEDAVENTATLLRLYQRAYDRYVYTHNEEDKEAATEEYNKYLTAKNEMDAAEKKYLDALFDYDPREEIKYCGEKSGQLNDKIVKTKQGIAAIEEENKASLAKKEQMEENIGNLKIHIAKEKDDLYNSKAPELSPEAAEIKREADEVLNAAKAVYDQAYSDWYNEVIRYKTLLGKWSTSFSWSWAISSTASRSSTANIYGSKMVSVLPQSIDTLGRYISTGVAVELSFPAIGTVSGYGRVENNLMKVSSKSGNGFTWRQGSDNVYLSKYGSTDYGFNYNTISNYAQVIAKYKTMEEKNGVYSIAQQAWEEVMSSNVELSNYMAFIKAYNVASATLKEDEAKLAVLEGQYNELIEILNDILISLNAKQEELKVITVQYDDYINEGKRAALRLETFAKIEKIDSEGNVIYTTLNSMFDWESDDGVPLGDADSGTTFRDSASYKWIVIGFDDDDKNRARVLYWNEDDKTVEAIKWYGCVDVKGLITGEPIPDPKTFLDKSRQSNGTYKWDMAKDGTRIKGSLICGYHFNGVANKYEAIEVDAWEQGQSVRVNLSANDTLTSEEQEQKKPDPIRYFVSNYADSRGIYYDYGPGWVKTYVRKINPGSNQILDCYIYTYGMVSENNLPYRKESVMAKGKTKVWTYDTNKLNKRVYTVGGTNKADDSLLGSLPFSVSVLPEETNSKTGLDKPALREQIYGLTPISFSYNISLVTNGEDHSGHFQVFTHDDTVILCSLSMVYVIKKTSSAKDFKIWKTADYYFQTNILSDDNILIEDRNGNINVERGSIPYVEECVLSVENLALTIPPSNQLVTNDTWYWAACYNPFFTKGVNSSYILPAISLPMYIESSQLEQFQTEAIEQRGSILKPMLKGLFDEYDKVDVFYTLATVTTTLYYKVSNIVKTSDIDEDKYDIFGKETYDIDMAGTTYSVSTSTQFFPIGVGSVIKGINYITPTIELEDEYAVRLYTNNNRVYGGYQYAARIFNGTNVFTIYGRNYYYDRQGIYFIGTTSTYTANQFVCYVLGMKYLANSGSEAYFYSEWDKQIYIFTGSNTLQRMASLSNQAVIKDSIFSSQEQILYLLTEDDKLLMLLEGDVAGVQTKGGHLEGTELGCAVVNDSSYQIISPYKEGLKILPFRLKTAFLGSDSALSKMSHFDFLAYKVDEKPVTFTLRVDTLNGIERNTEVKDITITPAMWKGRTYRIRFSPRNNVGNSFSVGVSSNDNVAVSFHGWEVQPIGNGSAPRSR